MSEIEMKRSASDLIEFKEIDRDGVKLGVIDAYLATWGLDRGGRYGIPDRFQRGAFADSLAEHRGNRARMVRLKFDHQNVIGGFPIESMVEDERGLRGTGEINLEIEEGAKVWSLIKQGVLVDMSVGFVRTADHPEDGARVITEAMLLEGSVVPEPCNPGAHIIATKSAPFLDLPLAPLDYVWDAAAALGRVESSGVEVKGAFAQCVESGDMGQGLQIADVIDGALTVVPAALRLAAEEVKGAPDNAGTVEHLERYFAKLGQPSPFDAEERRFFGATEVREWKAADVERALLGRAQFSKGAAKALASRLAATSDSRYDRDALARILSGLKDVRSEIEPG